jgi:methylenetetrahydrofolate/methylenetetrahydromethanopterin dehydrogenase (NADP+)
MRRLLLQLDPDRRPSAFDRIVACDAGADEVLSYGGVAAGDVQALVHGAVFTRGPKDLKNTAAFIGGSRLADADALLRAALAAFFGPFRVSILIDPNGCNTTAPVEARLARNAPEAEAALDGAALLLSAGPPSVTLCARGAWAGRAGLRAAADVNAVPPAGLEGVEAPDDGVPRDGVVAFGALGIGGLKMKLHKAAIARLFERNDLVLDAEEIYDLAAAL